MSSKRQMRAAAFIVWAALLLLLATAVLRTTGLGANLAKFFTPAPTATVALPTPTPVPLHLLQGPAPIAQSDEILAGPNNTLWLSDSLGIVQIDVLGNVLSFDTFHVSGGATSLCVGPDGAIWFTETTAAKTGRIGMDGSMREYALPDGLSGGEITAGPDGALWFGLSGAIGRMSTSGQFKTLPLTQSGPHRGAYGITAGPDGAIWFADAGTDSIGRMSLDGAEREYQVPSAAELSYITVGPDDALWFTEGPQDVIGRVTTIGQFAEFPTPDASSSPTNYEVDQLTDITAGPDKALWFTEAYTHRIGRITTRGVVTDEYSVPAGTKTGGPVSITATSSAVWFTVPDMNEIGRIDVGVVTAIGSGR